mmetsp:Transcript_32513/g.37655  ORF Transcript_32513/g.37655 Transcript_32513/m.37655 type:complete len:528 (+) Transcript_32513:134-1717(+)
MMTMKQYASLLLLSPLTSARELGDTPDNVLSRLEIHIPQKLFRQDGYEHREALFGFPPYGGSIAQMVYYADSDLCGDTIDTRKGYPIRPLDDTKKMEPWPTPFILMLDRGGCTFVQKVRNAQKSGAAGVIVADNVCLCNVGDECTSSDESHTCQTGEPIMADDGSGSDVTIPAFLMYKQDADLVKAHLKSNEPVQMEMTWNLPSPDDRVEYDLWTVPTDKVSREFQSKFMDAAKALSDHAYFTPHMYVYDGIKSKCRASDGSETCYNLCTNHGRYCATDPDNNLDQGISGADVVIESLRRICIWKHYGEDDGVGIPYWTYVNEFVERCDTPDFYNNEDCLIDVYKQSKIDGGMIEQCMKDSGGTTNDGTNSILEEQLELQTEMGVVILPTAFVNQSAIRGKLTFENMFKAICAGYLESTEPLICTKCAFCPEQHACVVDGQCLGQTSKTAMAPAKKKGVNSGIFVVTILLIIGSFAVAGLVYHRRTQESMREQVKGILAEYMPLEGDDGEIGMSTDFARKGGETMIG